MKKILIAIIAAMAVSSCAEYPVETTVSDGKEEYVDICIHDPWGSGYDYKRTLDLVKFEYEGHRYIYMRLTGSEGQGTFLHDPNCPCLSPKVDTVVIRESIPERESIWSW